MQQDDSLADCYGQAGAGQLAAAAAVFGLGLSQAPFTPGQVRTRLSPPPTTHYPHSPATLSLPPPPNTHTHKHTQLSALSPLLQSPTPQSSRSSPSRGQGGEGEKGGGGRSRREEGDEGRGPLHAPLLEPPFLSTAAPPLTPHHALSRSLLFHRHSALRRPSPARRPPLPLPAAPPPRCALFCRPVAAAVCVARYVVQTSNSGQQLLSPLANWRPAVGSRATARR